MRPHGVKWRVSLMVAFTLILGFVGLFGLLKPLPNGCSMTYMYPTYISLSVPSSSNGSVKYGLYLYHEGWRKIDFDEHLSKLSGAPVLFIPGNGGSYKQVRSLGAESDRAFQGGPLDHTYYEEASFTPEEVGVTSSTDKKQLEGIDQELGNLFSSIKNPLQYVNRLDWFAVDLEGEHSAMDGRILEEHTEYVVRAIQRILDHYKDVYTARAKDSNGNSGDLPRSVILVGHSMGGFVARAAAIHPGLRKGVVETIITLSSPHRSPPVALQPSLGHFFSRVNDAWIDGYKVQRTRSGRWISDPLLSNMVVVSIAGGIHDYQVRAKLASLDGIVPVTHGLTIVASGMRDVWLSMEHQSILWCNQLVVQLSHAMLHLLDQSTGQPYASRLKRMAVLISKLRSGIPQSFDWVRSIHSQQLQGRLSEEKEDIIDSGRLHIIKDHYSCPPTIRWADYSHERDLYIEKTTVTVLAMDGRRRWMDIQKMVLDGKNHFVLVTNLLPCVGIRVHLWPAKSNFSVNGDVPAIRRVVEVTSKMVHIPSGPAPRQIEPGSQTEQAPPSAALRLGPNELNGFRFLTISVAPRPTISGRPPPASSMAVGHFFNRREGKIKPSPGSLFSSIYRQQHITLPENHPLVCNLSSSISMGILPVTLALKTLSCGIKDSLLATEHPGDEEHNSLCKLRCFPPVALVWDPETGISVHPNLFIDTIVVDSSPALWGSRKDSVKTTLLLLVDPHCSYKVSYSISFTAAASRYLLLHVSQIIGFALAIFFFILMQQARAWELDLPVPSVLSVIESNLRSLSSFIFFALGPLALYILVAILEEEPLPPLVSFVVVCLACYAFANGIVGILTWITETVFYMAACIQLFFKQRCQAFERRVPQYFTHVICRWLSFLTRYPVLRILKGKPTIAVAILATLLICFVHPALGLIVLLLHHACSCHTALCRYLPLRKNDWPNLNYQHDMISQFGGIKSAHYKAKEGHSPTQDSSISYGDTQLEAFSYQQCLLLLHMTATIMLFPSLIAWGQRLGMDQSIPWFLDSSLSLGILLHGFCASKPNHNLLLFPAPFFGHVGLSLIYCLAGFYCYISALNMAPYRAFYALASVGILSIFFRVLDRRYREKGGFNMNRRHSHRH